MTLHEDIALDARLFTPAEVLPSITDEIALIFLKYLRVQELHILRLATRDFNRLVLDNYFWCELYVRDFGPLITTAEARLQYLAAHLFLCANTETSQISRN